MNEELLPVHPHSGVYPYPCEAFDICNFASRLADRQKGFCGFCGCHLATDFDGIWTLDFGIQIERLLALIELK